MSWIRGELVGLSIAFCVALPLGIGLALMIAKTKRVQEKDTPDRKRHVDVLFTAVACNEALSSAVIYPLLISIAQNDASLTYSVNVCSVLANCSIFFATFTAALTFFVDIHGFLSSAKPFQYFIYLKRKNSKIPFLCIGCSLFVGVVSLVLSLCGFHFFDFKQGRHFGRFSACVPQMQDSSVVYYYVVLIHLVTWTHLLTLVHTLVSLCRQCKWRTQSRAVVNDSNCCGMPDGANFKLSYKMLYLFTWVPMTVVMTMLSCGYQVSSDVILACCYVILSTGPLSPFVFYFTHRDFKDTVDETINSVYFKIKGDNHHPQRGSDSSMVATKVVFI